LYVGAATKFETKQESGMTASEFPLINQKP
jgi:hypothetical protein